MSATILEFPRDELERRALRILRDRNSGRFNRTFTEDELEWAIDIIKQWAPDHPLLRDRERPNAFTELDAS